MCLGTTMSITGILSGVCSAAVCSVSSGSTYGIALTVLGASISVGGLGMLGLCAGLYLSVNAVRTRAAYP